MSKFSALAAGFTALLLSAQFASAQTAAPSGNRKGPGPLAACKVELEKFCATVERGGGRKIKCLQEHTADLSTDCKSGITAATAARAERKAGAAAAEKQ